MSDSLKLPAHFLATVALHNRYFETGGWLFARRESPHQVVVATGPGAGSEHARDSVAVERKGVDEAAAAAGFVLSGCWHSHPPGRHGMTPSPEDFSAWRGELAKSPGLDAWHGVIVLRDEGRTEDWSAWVTRRSGVCEPVELGPITKEMRARVASLEFGMRRGPLIEPPEKWQPAMIQRELARLELDLEIMERVRLKDLNARLERLGIRGTLRPVSVKPAEPKRKPVRKAAPPIAKAQRRLTPQQEMDELRRRLDTSDADFETVLLNLQAELGYTTAIDDLYRKTYGGRSAAARGEQVGTRIVRYFDDAVLGVR